MKIASLKIRQNQIKIQTIVKTFDILLIKHKDIENEVMNFYGDLVGSADNTMDDIDIVAMRQGPQLTLDLISHVTEVEIKKALADTGHSKSPSLDGYGAKIFKTTWSIVKKEVIEVVMEFFT